MKKKLFVLAAVLLSFVMGIGSLFGCNLVTTDNERDLEQVVATVNIGNENAVTENIYKKDMVMAYLNYGYYLAYSQNYTQEQVFNSIIENLVDTRIIVQYVMAEREKNGDVKHADVEKWNVERYIDDEAIVNAKYNAIKSMNDFIKGYVDSDEGEKKADTDPATVRTVPTDAKNAEEELTQAEKSEYIAKGVDKGEIGSARRKAYNRAVKVLENNRLLGDDYEDDLTRSDYYKDTLKGYEESELNDDYEKEMLSEARSKVTFAKLAEKYQEMYDAQVTGYTESKSAFTDALSAATATNPVLYTPYSGYGYVYNLLLGVSDEQSADLSAITTTDKAERDMQRRTILSSTKAKDLRSTWITSGYDFDYDTYKFTGDYAFSKDYSLPFQGEVERLSDKTDDEAAQYCVKSVREFGLDEFIEFIDDYVYGAVQTDVPDNDTNVYRKCDIDVKPVDYDEKINELLFAFSTDPGSLNKYKGYVISPEPDADGSESWVKEFADAGRELLTMGKASYVVVATDYGYHFMFYSQVLNIDDDYSTLVKYLNALSGENGDEAYWTEKYAEMLDNWDDADEDSFLYGFAKLCAGADEAYNQKTNKIVNAYRYDEKCVKVYTERFADLLG